MIGFWIGAAVGGLAAIPLSLWAVRRATRKVRQLEQRARTAERLAELGTLTGGLAHEIKNPLSTIGLNIQLIQEDLDDFAPPQEPGSRGHDPVGRVRRRFDSLSREALRLRDILEDFLRFAGRMKLELKPVDINHEVDELADFFAPQAQGDDVNLRTQLAASPATVLADAALLKQALLNLMINATQAMKLARSDQSPAGGNDELIVRTQRARVLGRDEVHIHVIDTGPGIPLDKLPRVFEPYYSTKKGGTGLGLPTARRIIEEHDGALSVHSEPGRGTDFLIALPAA